ncbi:MAG: bifunctional phosphoribosyl-AMP cyclohydrolase/phosphoribosyl-ATP diphosphatase HisIE [Bacteroidetes bacterium]|nr:bifunctional phosphoribosyl-AMP cyclohydrolase/phosphoribosyl-ATP diphosphatase HisIE [Bacteroidota bacterium]
MKIDFTKGAGLVPAIIQDAATGAVLMLGFMNEEAFQKTQTEKRVTFFSRSKNRLWTKGEESGNFLDVVSILIDCDHDTLLIKAKPHGPVCHTGTDTCWNEKNSAPPLAFLAELEATIAARKNAAPEDSYTAKLFSKGINKIAQKVGEEATELIIEAKDDNPDLFLNEAADLLFHYLILLRAKGYGLADVITVLEGRKK